MTHRVIPDSPMARTDPLKHCQRSRRRSSSRKPKCPTTPPRVYNAIVRSVRISGRIKTYTKLHIRKGYPKVTRKILLKCLDPWRTANMSTFDIHSILSITMSLCLSISITLWTSKSGAHRNEIAHHPLKKHESLHLAPENGRNMAKFLHTL